MSQRDIETEEIRKPGVTANIPRRVHLTLGTLYSIAGGLVTAAIFIYAIKSKVDSTADDVSALRSDLKPVIEHTAILWDEHQRQASIHAYRAGAQ